MSISPYGRDMRVYAAPAKVLEHAALVPEVQVALDKWVAGKTGTVAPGVLIGGLALAFYAKPRYTQDVDLLFLEPATIPSNVPGFRRHRPGAFEDLVNNVEVEVNTKDTFKPTSLTQKVINRVFTTSVDHQGIRVASREGLVALKLCSAENIKREFKDLADVVLLLENGHSELDMSGWGITDKQAAVLDTCRQRARA